MVDPSTALMRCMQQCRCLPAFLLEQWRSGSGGARNAGIFAVQILALQYPELEAKLQAYKTKMSDGVAEKAARLQEVGYQNY